MLMLILLALVLLAIWLIPQLMKEISKKYGVENWFYQLLILAGLSIIFMVIYDSVYSLHPRIGIVQLKEACWITGFAAALHWMWPKYKAMKTVKALKELEKKGKKKGQIGCVVGTIVMLGTIVAVFFLFGIFLA
jgi:hypothetical protein